MSAQLVPMDGPMDGYWTTDSYNEDSFTSLYGNSNICFTNTNALFEVNDGFTLPGSFKNIMNEFKPSYWSIRQKSLLKC
ncbi:hypothetical protein WDU94_012724 [Cyamophila willieti]